MFSANRNVLMTIVHSSRFSLSAIISKTHYDSLGITPKATQTDIKAAYYKLSMMYHPDKNKGSQVASDKFRAISAAYEVLGNYRLRKLYDKGILHTAGPQFADTYDATVEDDDQTKFYKSRTIRDKPPTPTGRTPIYDFDEWSQAHYGDTFSRRVAAKEKYYKKMRNQIRDAHDIEKEAVVFGLTVCFIVFLLLTYSTSENHDVITPQETNKHLNNMNLIPETVTSNDKQ